MSDHDQKFIAAGRRSRKIGQLVTALDLGSTKITCLMARTVPPSQGPFELAGHGLQTSRGLKGGVVIDMDGLERSVRLAVEDAERMSSAQATDVRVSVTGPYLETRRIQGDHVMNGREVSQKDVHKLLEKTLASGIDDKLFVLHAFPLSYSIDGNEGVRDPRGMFAEKLGVTMNLVTMPMPIYRNIVLSVSRAHLSVESISAAPFASSDAVLTDDERDNGAICIDLGGSSTGISVFQDGALAFVDTLPVGGHHITSDLAHGIGTTMPAAERIKTLHGSVLPPKSGPADFVETPKIGDDGRLSAARMPKSELTGFILPRVEENFELVSRALSKSGLGSRLPRRVVLTGGGSELPGIRELAARVLAMPVRLARPLHAAELGEICQRASFSAAAGLLTLGDAGPTQGPAKKSVKSKDYRVGEAGVFGRAVDWLKENI